LNYFKFILPGQFTAAKDDSERTRNLVTAVMDGFDNFGVPEPKDEVSGEVTSYSTKKGYFRNILFNVKFLQECFNFTDNTDLKTGMENLFNGMNADLSNFWSFQIETDAIEGYDEALRHVHRLTEKNPDKYFFCDQYANDNNWLAHYHGTAEEIIQQLNGKTVDYFVGGVGTGGSITGIGRKLKEVFKHVTIIGIRPEIWPGIEGLKPLGSPEDIVPDIYDDTIVDQWIDITADEAKNWANMVAKKGFFVGQSSGAYLAATSKLLEKIKSGNVVTIINDLGERYFSAGLWD